MIDFQKKHQLHHSDFPFLWYLYSRYWIGWAFVPLLCTRSYILALIHYKMIAFLVQSGLSNISCFSKVRIEYVVFVFKILYGIFGASGSTWSFLSWKSCSCHNYCATCCSIQQKQQQLSTFSFLHALHFFYPLESSLSHPPGFIGIHMCISKVRYNDCISGKKHRGCGVAVIPKLQPFVYEGLRLALKPQLLLY